MISPAWWRAPALHIDLPHSIMDLIIPDWPGLPPHIGACSTTRQGGVSPAPYDDGAGGGGLNLGSHVGDNLANVQENRARLQALLPAPPAWLSQVHGTTVLDAAKVSDTPAADASFTSRTGVVCAIQTADCLPVLLCDRAGTVVGAAHAGWRGLAGGVLDNTVAQMRDAGAAGIHAWLGPAIGPQRFEVGEDVLLAFTARDAEAKSAFVPVTGSPGKYLADIYYLARIRLARLGIDQVHGGGCCTMSDDRRFFSYRRDQITGRMASLIWIK